VKAQLRLKRMWVEIEGASQVELFGQAARVFEVFGEERCGLCGGEDIVPVVRKVLWKKKECDYHEWHCQNGDCRARLSLSANMDKQGLFPNRRLLASGEPATGDKRGEGRFGPHNGWTKWRGEPKAEE
jgi:hypothetical protein